MRGKYRLTSLVLGIVKSPPVPDEHEGSGRQGTAGSSLIHQEKTAIMFITKKHLSRRTILRGGGVALALPLLDAMIPASTALAQTAATPKPRFFPCFAPHRMAPAYVIPATTSPPYPRPPSAASRGAESASGLRAGGRRRPHGRPARQTPQARWQHSRFALRQPLTPAQRIERPGPGQDQRLYGKCARNRAPFADCHEGLDGRAVGYDGPRRCAANLR